MESRFGLKDFFLIVLTLGVGVLVLMSMRQSDRLWDEVQELKNSASEQRRMVASMQRSLERGVVVGRAGGGGGPAVDTRDESWARPGVPVVWLPPLENPSPPEVHPGFAPGGTFTEIFEAQFPKIVPFLYADVYGRRIVDMVVCEQLAQYDPATLEYRGVLGVAYQMDPGGMWLRVRLRDGVKFSDGEAMTAEDVRFSFHDYVFNPELQTERFRSTLNVIDRVEVVDDLTVDFVFKEPKFNNLDEALRFGIVPEHFYSRFTPSQLNQATGLLMGTGPYRLERVDVDDQWAPPEDVVLVRNEHYWGEPPPFDRRRYTVVADNIARLTAFENGRGDMMRGTYEQYRRKTEDPAFIDKAHALAWNNMRSGYAFIAWNAGPRNGVLTPFHDARVRRAMTHLLDRERIRRDVFEGLGVVATGPFSSQGPMSNPDIEPLPYDPDRARELLAEAGWVDTDNDGVLENERGEEFEFEFTHSVGSSTGPAVGRYLKDQCARVGVRCNIRIVDWSIYFTLMDNRDFDAITLQWSQSKPESDPYQLWHSNSIQNQGDNFVQWASEEADRLIERGRATVDTGERMQIWHELHRVIHEAQPYTFVVEAPWIRFVSREIGNVHPYRRGLNINEMFRLP